MDIQELRAPTTAAEQTQAQLLIAMARTIQRQETRLRALEGRAAVTDAELADFRALADIMARYIGERQS